MEDFIRLLAKQQSLSGGTIFYHYNLLHIYYFFVGIIS